MRSSVGARVLNSINKFGNVEGAFASSNEVLDILERVVVHLVAFLVVGGHEGLEAIKVDVFGVATFLN